MNEFRSYGIELEFVSKISHEELTSRLNIAFVFRNIEHTAYCSNSYHHNRDPYNVNTWDVKADSSIQAPDICDEFPYGIEIASPVLKGKDGLKALKAVCEVLSTVAKVGKTTGLHVHHGIKTAELRDVAKAWGKIQDAVYTIVPPSRRNNRYCAKWHSKYDGGSVIKWYRNFVGTRYVGLNLESYWLRGTVEFRMAAGSMEYEKISNWVIYTQMLIDNASKIAYHAEENFDLSGLNKLLGNRTHKRSEPAEGTKSAIIWGMAKKNMGCGEILNNLEREFNYRPSKQLVRNLIKAAKDSMSVEQEADMTEAILWSVKRYNKFNQVTA